MLFSKKNISILISSIFGVVLTVSLFAFAYYFYFINSRIEKPFELVINRGTTKAEVINKLCFARCNDFFHLNLLKVYLYLNPGIVIEAGTYEIKEKDSFSYILNNFRNGTKQLKVTFLPGWSVEEYSIELKNIKGANFAKNYYDIAKKDQGYLYPDTYYLDVNTTPESLIKNQKDNFNIKTKTLFNSNTGISLEQKVIIASIVQREALGIKDNKIIAGILLKRFKEGMPLDADATNQYAVFLSQIYDFKSQCLDGNFCINSGFEMWKKALNSGDLKIESPFNTRGIVGLPPYPISNPSISSIEAVVMPKDTSFYYYLHDIEGNTYYAKTLEEHIANINKYL